MKKNDSFKLQKLLRDLYKRNDAKTARENNIWEISYLEGFEFNGFLNLKR